MQTDDHQETDHPEHRYTHTLTAQLWLGHTFQVSLLVKKKIQYYYIMTESTTAESVFVCLQTTGWTRCWGRRVKPTSPSSVSPSWTRRRPTASWRVKSSPASNSNTQTRSDTLIPAHFHICSFLFSYILSWGGRWSLCIYVAGESADIWCCTVCTEY